MTSPPTSGRRSTRATVARPSGRHDDAPAPSTPTTVRSRSRGRAPGERGAAIPLSLEPAASERPRPPGACSTRWKPAAPRSSRPTKRQSRNRERIAVAVLVVVVLVVVGGSSRRRAARPQRCRSAANTTASAPALQRHGREPGLPAASIDKGPAGAAGTQPSAGGLFSTSAGGENSARRSGSRRLARRPHRRFGPGRHSANAATDDAGALIRSL